MKKYVLLLFIFFITSRAGDSSPADPFSFMPSRMHRMQEAVFHTPRQLIEINPDKPLLVTDREGNKMFTMADGKVMLRIDISGKRTFSVGGRRSHQRSRDGEIERRWVSGEDGNLIRVENERGETVGYEEHAFGGKLIAEYDENKNITRSMEYDKYGKISVKSLDHLTMAETVYGDNGLPEKELDFEGNVIARYKTGNGRILSRENIYGDVTYYDENGKQTETYDREGRLIETYNYRTCGRGYTVLDFVKDERRKITTVYDDNERQVKDVDSAGNILREYRWYGSELVYTIDGLSREITWFDNQRPVYSTYKGDQIKEWFYDKGRLIGIWDETENKLTTYLYGRAMMELYLDRKPVVDEVLNFRREMR